MKTYVSIALVLLFSPSVFALGALDYPGYDHYNPHEVCPPGYYNLVRDKDGMWDCYPTLSRRPKKTGMSLRQKHRR